MIYRCDVLKVEVKSPCQLKECKFNIDCFSSKNCLKLYPEENLSLAEFSHLYKKPYRRVKQLYFDAVEKIFDRFIEENIEDKEEFYYEPDFKHSAISGKKVKTAIMLLDRYVIERNDIQYSVKVLEKAIYHGIKPEAVIRIALKLFKNNKLMDKFLELPHGMSKKLESELKKK